MKNAGENQNLIPLRELLNQKLLEARLRNPQYSLRAFAKRLSLSAGALSGLMNGKRLASRKLAESIAERLCLSPEDRAGLLSSFPEKKARGESQRILKVAQLDADQFQVISEWWHFAILNLIETRDFRNDPQWIANRLNIRPGDVRLALERLERLGAITEIAGRLRRTNDSVRTSDGVKDVSVRRAHFQNLELARKSLEEDDVGIRDFIAMTMAIDFRKFSLAREKIRSFLREMDELMDGGSKSDVYKLCVQLIPLTKPQPLTGEKK